MSLTPLLIPGWCEDLENVQHLLNPNFGLCLHPEQLPLQNLSILNPEYNKLNRRNYMKPWNGRWNERGTSTVEADKNKFQVDLDVQQFEPDEIDVKVVGKCVVVTAKHEDKRDEHGWISRQFERKYLIPEQCDLEQVTSRLSSDGVLTICVPRKTENGGRVIKIEHTGKPAVQARPSQSESKTPEKEENSETP